MAVMRVNSSASIVRLSFEIARLPKYLQQGLDADKSTLEVEHAGQQLVLKAFPVDLTADFVRKVCCWAGYAGIAGKVLRHNSQEKIAETMKRAYDHTEREDLRAALEAMLGLRGLAVSFASKHLKFLNPNRHVVLDSTISERLGYPRAPDGYCEFVADCASVLTAVKAAKVMRPSGNPFRIADVEMAIFQILRSQEQ
jgi:hypothetical protein